MGTLCNITHPGLEKKNLLSIKYFIRQLQLKWAISLSLCTQSSKCTAYLHNAFFFLIQKHVLFYQHRFGTDHHPHRRNDAELADYSHWEVGLALPEDVKIAETSDLTLASCLLPDMWRIECGGYISPRGVETHQQAHECYAYSGGDSKTKCQSRGNMANVCENPPGVLIDDTGCGLISVESGVPSKQIIIIAAPS